MNYRLLGRTGQRVSALALGTVELGMDYGIPAPDHYGRPDDKAAIGLVHAALEAGINYVDTARAYGESERILGKALQGRRHSVVLATKVGILRPDGSVPSGADLRRLMEEALRSSLHQLQTDYVDVWQLHNFAAPVLAEIETVADVFEQARRRGQVRWVGASTYGTEAPTAALATALFDVLQVTYSVLDQRLSDRLLPAAAAADVGVVVRSILLKGALTERADYLPDHLKAVKERSRHFRQLVADSGLNLTSPQAAIAFGLAHPQIGTVLVGVRTADELQENLHATRIALPAALLTQLGALRVDDPDLLNPGTWGIP